MSNGTSSLVTITFDGLFLFELGDNGSPCKARICTAAEGHQLQIKIGEVVFPNTGNGFFQISDLLTIGDLSIQVEGANGPLQTSARDDGTFGQILKVKDLYPNATINNAAYRTAFLIRNGEIGAGDVNSECRQVQLEFFKDVPFDISDGEWQNIIADRKATYGDHIIKNEVKMFARDVRVEIGLEPGQQLRFVYGENQDLVTPLAGAPGRTFDIKISYLDADPPRNLEGCMGIGHHSEAVKPANEVTWAFFRPVPRLETAGACCEVVRFP